MKDPETATVFAGLDGRTDTELPEWYAEQHADPNPVSFSAAIRELPQTIDTAVAYRNPFIGMSDLIVKTAVKDALSDKNHVLMCGAHRSRDSLPR